MTRAHGGWENTPGKVAPTFEREGLKKKAQLEDLLWSSRGGCVWLHLSSAARQETVGVAQATFRTKSNSVGSPSNPRQHC